MALALRPGLIIFLLHTITVPGETRRVFRLNKDGGRGTEVQINVHFGLIQKIASFLITACFNLFLENYHVLEPLPQLVCM